jgi:hypothetical protein
MSCASCCCPPICCSIGFEYEYRCGSAQPKYLVYIDDTEEDPLDKVGYASFTSGLSWTIYMGENGVTIDGGRTIDVNPATGVSSYSGNPSVTYTWEYGGNSGSYTTTKIYASDGSHSYERSGDPGPFLATITSVTPSQSTEESWDSPIGSPRDLFNALEMGDWTASFCGDESQASAGRGTYQQGTVGSFWASRRDERIKIAHCYTGTGYLKQIYYTIEWSPPSPRTIRETHIYEWEAASNPGFPNSELFRTDDWLHEFTGTLGLTQSISAGGDFGPGDYGKGDPPYIYSCIREYWPNGTTDPIGLPGPQNVPAECYGCNDINALNFSPTAVLNDGSCWYEEYYE